MPIYEYQCTQCGERLEVIQKLSDRPLRKCPACKKLKLRKLVSAAAFRLKGSGWYETDFKDKKVRKHVAGDDKAAATTTASDKPASDAGTGGAAAADKKKPAEKKSTAAGD